MKRMAIGGKIAVDDPTAVTPEEVIRAATLGGAKAQGRGDCGVLKEGNRADLIVMDLSVPNMHPVHNMVNNIVYSASGSDILMTMINGKVVYENGDYCTIDIERVLFEAVTATKNILGRL